LAKNELNLKNNTLDAEKGRFEKAESKQTQESNSHSSKHIRGRLVCLLNIRKCSKGTYNLESMRCEKGGRSRFREKERKKGALTS
jgi:hypothetical protein